MFLHTGKQRISRRILSSLTAFCAALGAVTALQLTIPAYACACGAFTPPITMTASGSMDMVSETAILSLKDGRESIDMRLGIDTLTSETGIIFPTPAPATVTLGEIDDFAAIDEEMTPERVTEYDWWSWPSFGAGSAGPGAINGAPHILDQVQLGPVQATTLASSDKSGLTTWLDANGYGIRPEVSSLLDHYIQAGWYFVALKVTGDTPLDGELDPLRFTFDSDHLVYPMYLSRAATTTQYVNLFVFADHRQEVRFLAGAALTRETSSVETIWAAPVKDPNLAERGHYLTATQVIFYSPAEGITDDLRFVQAATDKEEGTVIYNTQYVRFFFIPVGWLVIGLILVGLLIASVRISRPYRLRPSKPQPTFRWYVIMEGLIRR